MAKVHEQGEPKFTKKLANMAGSAGQFSCPSGMGGNWELFGMTIIRKK